jgi:hypothetical protein
VRRPSSRKENGAVSNEREGEQARAKSDGT